MILKQWLAQETSTKGNTEPSETVEDAELSNLPQQLKQGLGFLGVILAILLLLFIGKKIIK